VQQVQSLSGKASVAEPVAQESLDLAVVEGPQLDQPTAGHSG